MIHLTDAQIDDLVDFESAIPVLERGFKALAWSTATVQRRVRAEAGGVKLSTLGAVLPGQGYAGAKVYTTIKGVFSFVIVLFSTDDGRLLATLDANALTRIRTAATTVLAVRALARPDSTRLTVFGAGVQGRAHIEALSAALPLTEIRVVGNDGAAAYVGDSRSAFARRGIALLAAEPTEGVCNADVIVTATRATAPLFPGRLLQAGTVIAASGSSLPHTRELDDDALRIARRIVVELREQAKVEAGDLLLAAPGLVDWAATTELGHLLNDASLGRVKDEDILIYKAVGIGLQDIALAGLVWQRYENCRLSEAQSASFGAT